MRTPKEYTENLKKGIITSKMLEDALYSVNKRAKNYRDAARKNREYIGGGSYYQKNSSKKDEMYQYKEKLLELVKPNCIHKEFQGYKRVRVYDYQKDYQSLYLNNFLKGTIVWRNSFYNYEWYGDGTDEIVHFFDYVDLNTPVYQYYLYYILGEHSFHSLIENPENYNLPIIEVGQIITRGDDVEDLLSLQFVKEMLELIKTKKYIYIVNTVDKPKDYDNEVSSFVYTPVSWEDAWKEVRELIFQMVEEKYKEEKNSAFSREEIETISIKMKSKKVKRKNLETGKKYKVAYEYPYFSTKIFKNSGNIIPELSEADKEFIKNNYKPEMNRREFCSLLMETSGVQKLVNERLILKARRRDLSTRLNEFSLHYCCCRCKNVTREEVIEKFLQKQQNS